MVQQNQYVPFSSINTDLLTSLFSNHYDSEIGIAIPTCTNFKHIKSDQNTDECHPKRVIGFVKKPNLRKWRAKHHKMCPEKHSSCISFSRK